MELSQADESKVLIIYTGGTIGMLVGQQGYVPEPYFLTETLRSQARFHDPLQDSLFSNASSVEGFRQWSSNSSGRSSPLEAQFPPAAGLKHPTLLVRSSRPIAAATALAPANQTPYGTHHPTSRKVSEDLYEAHVPALVTPKSVVSGGVGKRIRYAVLEWHPLLDSSNIEIEGEECCLQLCLITQCLTAPRRADWIRIATEVELNYSLFDAFVILHGTDTMAYSSSALSFLLEDLGKTVIVTGAQIPLSQLRNDAVDNLLGSLSIAGHYIIPECCLFFNHTLFRGNRVSKLSSHDLNAFSSPNFSPLVNVGIDIVVNWNDVIRPTSLRRFKAHKKMSPHVATLRLFPGITAATVRAFLTPPIQGVVLETFGAGNAPQRNDLMSSLREACDRGVIIVAISQCAKGSVSDAYETGRTLLQAGVVPGGDMTPESALTKLSYLLSKPELSVDQVRNLMGTPLRGELTRPSGAPLKPTIDHNLESIGGVLSHLVRLSSVPNPQVPQIVISPDFKTSDAAEKATAPWSWTAAEAASTEGALMSSLIHLAAAADDVEGIRLSLVAESEGEALDGQQNRTVAGGVVNWINPASGRSPLQVAAINGSTKSVNALLEAGALVHLRDNLGHTALYYAARQGHEEVVSTLVKAGANLGGTDVEGYGTLAVRKALSNGDEVALRVWQKAGIAVPSSRPSEESL
ncbi:asparaginase-domain-containing protein [Artomyces pyxidatus]|uniref:Asparaginase-domain-containing protein n=1 Tax=Artomyces pyxidatus TaxID=48021 RepID=A0ACB8T4N4_9AGAM|nr:asparaginase-domain-containing protein [Artomyces pyxidatus]